MSDNSTAPDWAEIAEGFDLMLPHLAAVTERMLEALAARPGERVLDVACGTGEPGLTLARRLPEVRVTLVDAAAPMVEVVRNKAASEGLGNVDTLVAGAEALDLPPASHDAALCRFGLMFFDDAVGGCARIAHALRPGGRLVCAVWAEAEAMPTMHWAHQAFAPYLPADVLPALDTVAAFADPARLQAVLRQAGFGQAQVERASTSYRLPSAEAFWELLVASGVFAPQLGRLDEAQREQVRATMLARAGGHAGPGGVIIPHDYLLARAVRT